MVVAGAGQETNGGTAGTVGSTAAGGGSALGGDGGLAPGDAGHAGQVTRGGTGGDTSALAGGGGGAPGTNCRSYATEFTVTSSGSFQTVTCTFDRASLTQTCTTERGDITSTIWATLADAVRENRPLGARRADRVEQLIAFPAECRLTQHFQYDSSGRLSATVVTIDPEAPCGTNQAVYDAWDADGRPIHGIENGVGGELCAGGDLSFTYDDPLRTITTVHSGGSDCLAFKTIANHDADGLRTTAGNGTRISSTYQTLATGEICE